MNEEQLADILARNPAITTDDIWRPKWAISDHIIDNRKVPTPESERGTTDALDPVVQGETPSQTRPIIRFIFYRTRLVDADAVHAGAKDLLDGLVEAGLIAGDREEEIDFDARQEKVHYKREERTEIELTLP